LDRIGIGNFDCHKTSKKVVVRFLSQNCPKMFRELAHCCKTVNVHKMS